MRPPESNLRDLDLVDVLKVGRTALECNHLDELRNEVLHRLEHVFKVDSGNFFLTRVAGKRHISLNSIISRGIGEDFLVQYNDYYHKLDPFYRQALSSATNVFSIEDVISPTDLFRSEYYHNFLKPQSILHEMVIYLTSGNLNFGVVAVFRPPSAPDFSRSEKEKAELMVPYLAGALEKVIIKSEITKKELIVKSIVTDLRNKGIIILDENLEPIYQNEEASKISCKLFQGSGQKDDISEVLLQKIYPQCQLIMKSTFSKERRNPPQEQYNQIIRVGKQEVLIRLHHIFYEQNSPLFFIYLEPNESYISLSQAQKKFGLTRRELEVVNLVYRGLKNIEISDKLFISEHTVENHLKSIYQKLGVKNRTSLIHRMTHPDWPVPAEFNGSAKEP